MKKSITKEEVNNLDIGAFKGTIYVVEDEAGVDKAMELLNGESVLGFDTETKPSFKRGEQYTPSLLQLAGADFAVLFRLHATGLPDKLIALLESQKVLKVGIAIGRDLEELQEITPFEPGGFTDLNTLAPEKGYENVGVRRLSAMVLGIRISKRQQTSNWEAENLKPAQLEYAATDAWVCRQIFLKINSI
ncbi:MAG: 3'-5' exonuclease [Bacteroidales bacterium]|nr:3'-5' exonuclease [Bacteroidales bacterium]